MIRSIFYNWSRKDLMYPEDEEDESFDPTSSQDLVDEELDGENEAETILVSTGDENANGMWLVNLPRHLLERWSAVDEEGRQLATLRIWEMRNPRTGCPFISISVPSEEDPSVIEEYILDDVVKKTESQLVSAVQECEEDDDDDPDYEHGNDVNDDDPKYEYGNDDDDNDDDEEDEDEDNDSENGNNHNEDKADMEQGKQTEEIEYDKEQHTTTSQMLAGHVTKELVARPVSIATRDEPEQHIELLDHLETSMGDELIEDLPLFGELTEEEFGESNKKFKRIAYDRLLHLLLKLFKEKKRWDIRELTRHTKQSSRYLRKVLPDIATEIRAGRHKGKWELLPFY